MAHEIVLFHSAYGLRPAVAEFAEALRAEGHTVHTPDLFDGEVFSRLEDGLKKRDSVGIQGLMKKAAVVAAQTPGATVFAGFSLGAAAAFAAGVRLPGTRALVLMHGALDPTHMGIHSWPKGISVQVHYARGDEWVEEESVLALQEAVRASGAGFESHQYDCKGHLFADNGLPDYDAASARLMTESVLGFLRALR
jgi:dienelactone hydrolase